MSSSPSSAKSTSANLILFISYWYSNVRCLRSMKFTIISMRTHPISLLSSTLLNDKVLTPDSCCIAYSWIEPLVIHLSSTLTLVPLFQDQSDEDPDEHGSPTAQRSTLVIETILDCPLSRLNEYSVTSILAKLSHRRFIKAVFRGCRPPVAKKTPQSTDTTWFFSKENERAEEMNVIPCERMGASVVEER
jgi:hypothetical protein